ncbi:hypothetical protein QJS10_CPA08g01453 [Acorus calamus]|uniref:Uncharacterized protein n=1 Tax=Acorus calamus TaxID=4465 RepID=A0AAV9EFV8_ACOCL|nr:hypothetical protein QJS10_CPA08g01453 [Acorus calamus]
MAHGTFEVEFPGQDDVAAHGTDGIEVEDDGEDGLFGDDFSGKFDPELPVMEWAPYTPMDWQVTGLPCEHAAAFVTPIRGEKKTESIIGHLWQLIQMTGYNLY